MAPDAQLNVYRERLRNALRDRLRRRGLDARGEFQVFVNGDSVGTLTGGGPAPALVFTSHGRSIESLDIRSASGLLVGGLTAPETGTKTARFQASAQVLDVTIQNRPGGGSASVTCHAAPATGWRAAAAALAGFANRLAGPAGADFAWGKAALPAGLAAIVLAVILAQSADLTGVLPATGGSSPERPGASSLIALDHLDQRLADLAQAQTATYQALQAQQEEITRMHRTVDHISGMQTQIRGNVVTVEHRVRTVNRDLAAAKRALAQDVQALQLRNHELRERLVSEVVALSKAMPADKAAGTPGQPAKIPDARHEEPVKSLSFWVSFQDGTPEKNIEEFMQQIQGQRGPVSEGWQHVQVPLRQPLTSEAVLESVRKAKIVRAVLTTPQTGAARQ